MRQSLAAVALMLVAICGLNCLQAAAHSHDDAVVDHDCVPCRVLHVTAGLEVAEASSSTPEALEVAQIAVVEAASPSGPTLASLEGRGPPLA